MKKLPIFQVDAFASKSFSGNPAAVVPLQEWLSDDLLQAIASENNLSETAFFLPDGSLRWFTPAAEVELCGHATLATAHVMFNHLKWPTDLISFTTRYRGTLTVQRSSQGYLMDFPADPPQPVSLDFPLEQTLGVKPLEAFKGLDDYLLIVEDEARVAALKPDFRKLKELSVRGIIVSAPGQNVDFVSRCFFPQFGIDEDPVTGSAHTLMTPYWANRLSKQHLTARQISKRGGDLQCIYQGDRVLLLGQATTYLIGEIFI